MDDVLIFARSRTAIDDLVQSLTKEYTISYEGDVKSFLGVSVERMDDGTIELRQTSSIYKFFDLLGISDKWNSAPTPAVPHAQKLQK